MTFRNNFYYIDSVTRSDNDVLYALSLNADHIIYKAHFPGEPITPGVCILQIGLELLSDTVNSELEISCVKNVKYLSVLHPDCTPLIVDIHKIIVDDNTVKAQIDFFFANTSIAKMSLICHIVAE